MNPQWYFLIFYIFLEFSSTCLVGTKRNDIFYFPYFSSFSDLFWLEMNYNGISFIFSIFIYFYEIFYYASGRNEMKRYFLFSHFPSLFKPILAYNEATLVFFNFLNFFAIFLEFSFTPRVRMERKDNFYFLSFAAFSYLFLLEMKPQWYFLIFLIF